MVECIESLTSNPLTSLAWIQSPEDALVVWRGKKESGTGSAYYFLGGYQNENLEVGQPTI